jgi:hypothetical protein
MRRAPVPHLVPHLAATRPRLGAPISARRCSYAFSCRAHVGKAQVPFLRLRWGLRLGESGSRLKQQEHRDRHVTHRTSPRDSRCYFGRSSLCPLNYRDAHALAARRAHRGASRASESASIRRRGWRRMPTFQPPELATEGAGLWTSDCRH